MKIGILLSFLLCSWSVFANSEGTSNTTSDWTFPDTEMSYEEMNYDQLSGVFYALQARQDHLTQKLLCIEGVSKLENGKWQIVYPTNAEGRARHAKFKKLIRIKKKLASKQAKIQTHMIRALTDRLRDLRESLEEMAEHAEGHGDRAEDLLEKAGDLSEQTDDLTEETMQLYPKLLHALAKAFDEFAEETRRETESCDDATNNRPCTP